MNRIYPSARHLLGISLCSMLFGILLAMLGGSFYLRQLLQGISYTDSDPTSMLSQAEVDALLSQDPPDLSPNAVPLPTETVPSESAIYNLLLIGQDRREGETRARSDSMILCTFHTGKKAITLTSFLRDMYVKIPGYRSNRLNAAYAAGGMALLNKTLEQNFSIPIDGSIEVDFSRFPQVIDLLGGVEIELRQDEADHLGGSLTQGTQLLTGDQALAYARIRSLDSDGDFSRTERQRKLLTALISSCRGLGFTDSLRLAREVFPLLTTDLKPDQLWDLARSLLPMLSDAEIVSQHIPADDAYTAKTIDGMAVLVPDLDAARRLLDATVNQP